MVCTLPHEFALVQMCDLPRVQPVELLETSPKRRRRLGEGKPYDWHIPPLVILGLVKERQIGNILRMVIGSPLIRNYIFLFWHISFRSKFWDWRTNPSFGSNNPSFGTGGVMLIDFLMESK
jgi:hypothetical protein